MTTTWERIHKGRNVVAFPTDYVAIDVETTGLDYDYHEIIEVSAVKYSSGKIIDCFTSLAKPHYSHAGISGKDLEQWGFASFTDIPPDFAEEYFSSHFISEFIEQLTGIKNEDILKAPPVDDVIQSFYDFIGDSILVGHNVHFDVNFLYDACARIGLALKNDFVDTMRISRKLFPNLEHHRLSDIVEQLGVKNASAHRAESDAIATAQCLEKMRELVLQTQTIEEFIKNFKKSQSQRAIEKRKELLSIQPTVDSFDETNPIYGKIVVFTGTLSNMARKEAFQLVANLGGYPADDITKKTNFLVVGNEDFAKSVKNGRTNKMKKADKYRQNGFDIITLSENAFFDLTNS